MREILVMDSTRPPSFPSHLPDLGFDVEQGLCIDVLCLVVKVGFVFWVFQKDLPPVAAPTVAFLLNPPMVCLSSYSVR